MSKSIKQSILILGVLVLLSIGFAIVFYLQKQSAETRVAGLSSEVEQYRTKSEEIQKKLKSLTDESNKMRQDLDQRNADRDQLVKKSDEAMKAADDMRQQLEQLRRDSGSSESRLADLRKQRDELMKQVTDLKNRPVQEKIVEKVVYRDRPADVPSSGDGVDPAKAMNDVFAQAGGGDAAKQNEDYWAGIIRQKAALELELQKVKEDLSTTNVQMAELKKNNTDLEMELGRIKNEKDQIVRKIKYGEDLADNLSVELARARNEQKITQDRADQVLAENQQLRQDIKQLTTTKVALERSIANLTDEKANIEKRLVETENVIQGRIDEIWQIKKDIDHRFDTNASTVNNSQVELGPIVVSVDKKNTVPAAPSAKPAGKASTPSKKLQGGIVSINEENNFVIVDLGERTGIKVGDAFRVYHNGVQIGAIEIIQVRQDISAADIKQKTAAFSVGDTVR